MDISLPRILFTLDIVCYSVKVLACRLVTNDVSSFQIDCKTCHTNLTLKKKKMTETRVQIHANHFYAHGCQFVTITEFSRNHFVCKKSVVVFFQILTK